MPLEALMSRTRKAKKQAKASPGMTPKWQRLVNQMGVRVERRVRLGLTSDQERAMDRMSLRVKDRHRQNQR